MKNLLTLIMLALLLVLTVGGGVQADLEPNPESAPETDDHPWGGDECDEDVLKSIYWRFAGDSGTPASQTIGFMFNLLLNWSIDDQSSSNHSGNDVFIPLTGADHNDLVSLERSTYNQHKAQK